MTTPWQKLIDSGSVPNPLLLIEATEEEALAAARDLFSSEHQAKLGSGNHPDLHLYWPEGKGDIHTMESMQALIREMALPPFEAEQKVFLIFRAEAMSPASSNALLKTLEEPQEDALLLLATDHPEKLLPTILSRLFPVSFSKREVTKSVVDIAHLLHLAEHRHYSDLFDALDVEDVAPILDAYLAHPRPVRGDHRYLVAKIQRAELALNHHIKPRTVLLDLFLSEFA